MSDTTEGIVSRLRELPEKLRRTPVHLGVHIKLLQDAADEIELLRSANALLGGYMRHIHAAVADDDMEAVLKQVLLWEQA